MASKLPSRRDRNQHQTKAASLLVLRLIALSTLSLIVLSVGMPTTVWFSEVKNEDPTPWFPLEDKTNQTDQTDQAKFPFSTSARPVRMIARTIAGVPIYIAKIDLSDPETFISVGLANKATRANSARSTRGDESFIHFVRRHQAALTMSGTFFSMDAQKRVMGNLVSGGAFLKYSPWENYGTTLGIKKGNQLEMITARIDGKPKWQNHWFSLTAGPRLLRQGKIYIQPQKEGFADPSVMGRAVRSAIGFSSKRRHLLHVTFTQPVTLTQEAEIMKALGCWEAMNLDGGTSLALAKGNRILHGAKRNLTNIIMVYDVKKPAPKDLRLSWKAFQTADQLAEQ